MNENIDFIKEAIFRDMSEGIMTINMNGIISMANPAVLEILNKSEDIVNKPFARSFFEYEENDAFNQTILDAIYESNVSHKNIVQFFNGEKMKQLEVTTSYLKNNGVDVAVIAVISDITELVELQDAIKAMERIKSLNQKLELRNKLLSDTFGRFLSDEIVKELLDTPNGLALGGRKCELTIMMSDLRGFTAMSERMPAQDLLSMLNHYLAKMTEIIQSHNGTIIEFIGDGIMAIFGAPSKNENHARDAVMAAVEMQSAMDEINEWNFDNDFPILEMGIGINTGNAIVGNVGSEKRTKYGVTGSQVNLAGRIESYTVGGQVLINETTRNQISDSISIISEQKVLPKGCDKETTLYNVNGIVNYKFEKKTIPPHVINCPCEIKFSSITDKHVSDDFSIAYVTAISDDECVIETETELNKYDNLQFDIGDKLFGKVISLNDKKTSYVIRFTSKPSCFKGWKENLK